MKRKAKPRLHRAEVWVARGTPEHEAWVAQARADGRSIPEYRSAITGTVGFWRRSKFHQHMRHPRRMIGRRLLIGPRRDRACRQGGD